MTSIKYHSIIDSTQLEAIRLINKKELNIPTIIVAKKQSNGMGRKGRSWISDSIGNLYCSLVFYERKIRLENVNILPFVTCVSVQEIINADVKFKWPNDIMIADKKVCGILVQKIDNVVIIGIGLNLFSSPDGIKNISTSLKDSGVINFQHQINQDELISIASSIMGNITKVANTYSAADILDIWKKRAYRINQEITINGKTGVFKDIDSDGKIVIENQSGRYKFSYGDVS